MPPMDLPIATTIKELGVAKVAAAANIPFSTVYRWMQEDRIPGQGTKNDWRVQQFVRAVEKLRADNAKARKATRRQPRRKAA